MSSKPPKKKKIETPIYREPKSAQTPTTRKKLACNPFNSFSSIYDVFSWMYKTVTVALTIIAVLAMLLLFVFLYNSGNQLLLYGSEKIDNIIEFTNMIWDCATDPSKIITIIQEWRKKRNTVELEYDDTETQRAAEDVQTAEKNLKEITETYTKYVSHVQTGLLSLENKGKHLDEKFRKEYAELKEKSVPVIRQHHIVGEMTRMLSQMLAIIGEKMVNLHKRPDESELKFRNRQIDEILKFNSPLIELNKLFQNTSDQIQRGYVMNNNFCVDLGKVSGVYVEINKENTKSNGLGYYVLEYGKTTLVCTAIGLGLGLVAPVAPVAAPVAAPVINFIGQFITPIINGVGVAAKTVLEYRNNKKRKEISAEATEIITKLGNIKNTVEAVNLYFLNLKAAIFNATIRISDIKRELEDFESTKGHTRFVTFFRDIFARINQDYKNAIDEKLFLDVVTPASSSPPIQKTISNPS